MNCDYTFCVSECENENCFRHKVKIPKGIPVSMAKLKGTPECELVRMVMPSGREWVEVKRGRWKRTKAYPNIIFCSERGEPFEKSNSSDKWNYCPNCGARMEDEE